MKNYLLLYNTPVEVQARKTKPSPEEYEHSMKQWFAWKDKVGDRMVDFGAPTSGAQVVRGNQNWKASPAETSGYSIVKARDLDDLKPLLEQHPHTLWSNEASIEVHECMSV